MRFAALLVLVVLGGCASTQTRDHVAADVEQRVGHALHDTRTTTHTVGLPQGVRLDDGLSEDEAVAVAMWNHPRVYAELARIETAQAELADARRPANPTLRVLAPAGPQQLSALLTWPLENLVLLRRRVVLAKTRLEAVQAEVLQLAIDLGRDVRLAHVEWRLARDRLQVREQLSAQADAIAVLAEARVVAGEVAGREGDVARADAQVAADEAHRAVRELAITEARLRQSMGLGAFVVVLAPDDAELDTNPQRSRDTTIDARPDLRAAALAIEAATLRVRLEQVVWLRLAGVANLEGRSVTGGAQIELPIVDQNQGGLGRARAELHAAQWRQRELQQRAHAELVQGELQRARAVASLAAYRDGIVAARERDIVVVTAAYELGEQDYSAVLLAAQRLEGARLREVELVAELRRADAEIERAVGGRVAATKKEAP